MVAIVDDDDSVRSALQGLMKSVGLPARAFASAEEFLDSGEHLETGCLIADIRMPACPAWSRIEPVDPADPHEEARYSGKA